MSNDGPKDTVRVTEEMQEQRDYLMKKLNLSKTDLYKEALKCLYEKETAVEEIKVEEATVEEEQKAEKDETKVVLGDLSRSILEATTALNKVVETNYLLAKKFL